MKQTKADLLLHPVRLRIVRALASGKAETAQEISALMEDVPTATLYRQLTILTRGEIVAIVGRRQVRGASEKRYALLASGAHLSPQDLAQATNEDHLRYFVAFLGTLIGDFERYLDGGAVDLMRDGVGYRQVPLYLTDDEFSRAAAAINAALVPLLANGPATGRRRRLLTTIVMPADDAASMPREDEDQ